MSRPTLRFLSADDVRQCLSMKQAIEVMRTAFAELSSVHAELGELVLQRKPARESDDEITLFKSAGNAVQDLAAAAQVIRLAEKMNLGVEVALG